MLPPSPPLVQAGLDGSPPDRRSSTPPPLPHAGHLVHLETFGCQMNEYDSELVRALLKADGFAFTEDRERADVILMNTCAIRENAHNRVYGHLATLKTIKRQRSLVVGVLGCMAQNLKEELLDHESVVDLLAGPDAYRRLPGLVREALHKHEQGVEQPSMAVDLSEYETYQNVMPDRTQGINAWIAVMRGCDNFCSFCVVPYTRGRERSREAQGILREAERLIAQGHKQITLLGQNVNSYKFQDWDFARLITAVADLPGIERVRFTSPHPKDFPAALLDAVAGHRKICKHIHLPLQSGNDRILTMMDRTYSRQEYLALVDAIRRRHADIVLSTDIICGFPGETDDEFLDSYRTLQDVGYHETFIFKYSERKNTIAARKYPDDVPEAVKADRVCRLVDLAKSISLRKNQAMIGKTVTVLVEGDSKKSSAQWMGKSDGNITVVWEKSTPLTQPGKMVSILVDQASVTTLFGAEAVPSLAHDSPSRR
ncbi:MAG: tRNA (N6-isopentenyl adenosine(37)-C2)-methylthiotransferase MiaB [Nitrospira sp.]|nr:tRNA (N6-isopentenyl adenosine(37)-C2)-methylthiotransferase MiaB [Nitrospira sp.]